MLSGSPGSGGAQGLRVPIGTRPAVGGDPAGLGHAPGAIAVIPDRLPWHDRQWRRVERDIRAARVPHALLLRGAAGGGKALFAARLATALLCRSGEPPCGECDSCRLCAAGSHPDRIDVSVEEDRREIVVDQVRDLIHTVGLTARFGGRKVVVVDPAEQMNRHAANTLLKTLEEPPGETVFLLVSANPALLLATIRSRCQIIDFPAADPGAALEWLRGRVPDPAAALALAHGAPIRAVELFEEGLIDVRSGLERDLDTLLAGGDPMAAAARWKEIGIATVSLWLADVLAARLRESARGGAGTGAGRPGAAPMHFSRLLPMLDRCLEARGGVLARSNLNEQLALERLALGIADEGSGRRRPAGR